MSVQPNSRTDWRWRIAREQNWLQDGNALWLTPVSSAPPFIPVDFPNPRGQRRSLDLLTWVQERGPGMTAQEVEPFYQTDWPIPGGFAYRAKFPISDRGFVQSMPIEQMASPFSQTDWPVPLIYAFRRREPQRGYIQPANPEVLLPPWFQTDWPVPKGYRRASDLRGFASGFPAALRQSLVFGFNQYDWPVPKGYRRLIALRGNGPQGLPLIYPVIEAFPARYAPMALSNARYAPQSEYAGRYSPQEDAYARYAPETDMGARYAPEDDYEAQYAPQTDSEARHE